MVGEAAKKNLYAAATQGDVATFQELAQEDLYLVNEVSFACSRNLLHIAAMHEQVGIVEEVLKINKKLARNVDSHKSSPLHIAAAEGHVEIAKKLLSVAPETCWLRDDQGMNPLHIAATEGHVEIAQKLSSVAPETCWLRDDQGMNPLHIAAMNGHVEIVELLLQESPSPAMERLHRGETVLHLCVKHGQLAALKVLADKLGELVRAKDDDGETLLHLAVRCNQVEIIRYLVESNKIRRRTRNTMGKTPLKILKVSPPDTTSYREIKKILTSLSGPRILEFLPKMTDITMVVVVLIATMAFQAAISPPGGVWQDDTSSHRAGDAVMAYTHPKLYKYFVSANMIAFISSLITIFLITTGLPSAYIVFMKIAAYAMWMSLPSIAVSYGASIMAITPNTETKSTHLIVVIVIAVSLSIFGSILVLAYIQLLYFSWKNRTRRQDDLTNDAFIRRVFYWIFQQLETRR